MGPPSKFPCIGNILPTCSKSKYFFFHEWNRVNSDNLHSNLLDLLVAFGGHETMPHDVQPFVCRLTERIAIHGMDGVDSVWGMVRDTLISFPTTVTTNTVIAAYREQGSVMAKEVGMHRGERPLGYHFKKCGNPSCPSQDRPGHIMGEVRSPHIYRIRCKACKWKSGNVRVDDSNPYIRPLHETRAPLLFYHPFPSPAGLTNMFMA